MCFLWHWRQKQPLSRDCILAWLESVLSFPFVISGEGMASLKSRVGQGGSLLGGFEQKLKVAKWLLPTTRQGFGFDSPVLARAAPWETHSLGMWEDLYPHSSEGWNFPSLTPCRPLPNRAQKKLPQESLLPALRPHNSLLLGVSYENHSSNGNNSERRWKKRAALGDPLPPFLVLVYETKMAPLHLKLQRWVTRNNRKMLPGPWLWAQEKGSSQGQPLKWKEFSLHFSHRLKCLQLWLGIVETTSKLALMELPDTKMSIFYFSDGANHTLQEQMVTVNRQTS